MNLKIVCFDVITYQIGIVGILVLNGTINKIMNLEKVTFDVIINKIMNLKKVWFDVITNQISNHVNIGYKRYNKQNNEFGKSDIWRYDK